MKGILFFYLLTAHIGIFHLLIPIIIVAEINDSCYISDEVHRQLLLSRPKVIIGNTDTINVIKESLKMANIDIPVICVTTDGGLPVNTISFQELTGDADHSILKYVKKAANDVAILPYSSGTTGLPKGVELTNKNVVVNCVQSDVEGVKQYRDTTSKYFRTRKDYKVPEHRCFT